MWKIKLLGFNFGFATNCPITSCLTWDSNISPKNGDTWPMF